MKFKGSEEYKSISKLAVLVSLTSSVLFLILTKSANTHSSSIVLSLLLSAILGLVAISAVCFGFIWGIWGAFKYKNYEVIIVFILLSIAVIFLPQRYISKQQQQKREVAKVDIERMNQQAQIQENFLSKLDKIYKSHYTYYSEVFSRPHKVFPSPYTNVFILENGLTVYIVSPTITDKSFLRKTVEIKIPSYNFFADNYKIFDDYLTSTIMNASDESLQHFQNPTDPFWENKLRIPVEIFYEGKKVDS
jgi:hypothetical protein